MDPGTRHKLVAISRLSAFWVGAVVIGAGIEAAIGNVRAESVVWLVIVTGCPAVLGIRAVLAGQDLRVKDAAARADQRRRGVMLLSGGVLLAAALVTVTVATH
jgi:NADH:ubiquinone oxidoreductase subunit B-like Fe-S oxidoreductase